MLKKIPVLFQRNTPSKLRFLCISLLVLGIFFRFVNLDKKVFWCDETYTSLRISGHTETEWVQEFSSGGIINVKDLQKYQYPDSEKSVIDTIKSLAEEEPQHPPLYYISLRVWVQWFGNSVTAIRSLSALISLLIFPCIYWLCLELFKSSLVGWVAVAFIAVSPFHVLYAQEAREYSLWTVAILLSSASLLKAIRIKTVFSWVGYTATLAVGLYTYPLSGLVAIAHGTYLVIIEKFRLSKTVIAYVIASIVALIIYAPWLVVMIANFSQIKHDLSYLETPTNHPSLSPFLAVFIKILSRITNFFIDWDNPYHPLYKLMAIVILILVLSSIYFLCLNSQRNTYLFILFLILIPSLPIVLPDLLFGGFRTTFHRFLIPSYLGIQLAIVYLLASKIMFINAWQQWSWRLLMIILLLGGILSCLINSSAVIASTKRLGYMGYYNYQVAHIINQSINPLFISDGFCAVSLSHLIEPKVKFQIEPVCYICNLRKSLIFQPKKPKISNEFSDIFYLHTSNKLQALLEEDYNIKPVYEIGHLWRLEKKDIRIAN